MVAGNIVRRPADVDMYITRPKYVTVDEDEGTDCAVLA